ncbi:MAG TPA: ABC transporter substrate-binding protein [candidate division Zixibacteria bacterium]|nr:ABC transporter substrate-binding protein [candidate division Zixibacteria bacterium]
MKPKTRSLSLALLTMAAVVIGTQSGVRAAEKVRFLLDWIIEGKHVPFFVARDKGFFEKNGLEVTLVEGKGSGNAATFIDAGQADYSYGDFLTAVEVMSKGGKNRAIGVGMVFNGGGFIYREGAGIKGVKDLEGKSFGTNPGDFAYALLPALAAAAGFDHKKVTIKTMEPAVRTPALFEGKIDFMSGTNGSSIQRMAILAKRQGKAVNYLFFKDMGLQTYGHVLQARADRIQKNPDQVKRFVTALFDAWAWSLKNPKEAFDAFMKANPQKDRDISLAQMEAALDDVVDPETRERGLGYMKESMMKRSVEIANKYFGLSPAVDYRTTYTNQFIRKNPGM